MKIWIREEYFKIIHTKSLEQQLARLLDSKLVANFNENQKNIFLKSLWIANFFLLLSQSIIEQDLINCHFDIVNNLIALYFLQKLSMQDNLPSFFKDIKKPSRDKMNMLINLVLSLLKVLSTQCFFCLGNNFFCYKNQT